MTGGVWIASYLLLWVAVLVLSFAVVVLLRQLGVLHARLRPTGVHPAGEGPAHDAPAPPVPGADWAASELTLVAFTSPTCQVCAALMPSLHALARTDAGLEVEVVLHGPDTLETFRRWNVSSTPYIVAVDRDGTVRRGGVANSLEQVEVLVDAVRADRTRETDGAAVQRATANGGDPQPRAHGGDPQPRAHSGDPQPRAHSGDPQA